MRVGRTPLRLHSPAGTATQPTGHTGQSTPFRPGGKSGGHLVVDQYLQSAQDLPGLVGYVEATRKSHPDPQPVTTTTIAAPTILRSNLMPPTWSALKSGPLGLFFIGDNSGPAELRLFIRRVGELSGADPGHAVSDALGRVVVLHPE